MNMHLYTPGGSSDFRQELLAVRQDPQVRKLALRWAGAPDLAEDILQAAYCGLATLKHPERIDNLHAYFRTALRNEASRLYSARRTTPIENPEHALEPGQHGTLVCGPAPARPVAEMVCLSLQAQAWLKQLYDERDSLLATVPTRSADPARYRTVIYAAAEQVLRDAIDAEPGDADSNAALRAIYPEHFNQLGASPDTCHQRFRRAREDIKAILQAIIDQDELT
jgi:DNA-directed RNA polymerase specialized sigma24 family protein